MTPPQKDLVSSIRTLGNTIACLAADIQALEAAPQPDSPAVRNWVGVTIKADVDDKGDGWKTFDSDAEQTARLKRGLTKLLEYAQGYKDLPDVAEVRRLRDALP